MGIPGSVNNLLGAGGAPQYLVERSLRFNSSDSAYLSKSYSNSPTDRTKQTISFWAKFSNVTSTQRLFWGYDGSSNEAGGVSFIGSQIYFSFGGSGTRAVFTTPAVFRDPSAWYHILIKVDSTTTDPVTGHRVAIFVNGVQQTTGSDTIGVNALSQFGLANSNNRIGCSHAQTDFTSGYLAEVYFIDGQALTPSSFTEVSATTGQLIPKAYTGTFTGNSFWLKFADNSAATATTLGKDSSGLGNNWTPNNLSVTAGAGNDSLVDTPTSYGTDTGAGGEVRGNYATLNPVNKNSGLNLLNGNLDATWSSGSALGASATIALPTSGKWYCEITNTGSSGIGYGIGISDSGRQTFTNSGILWADSAGSYYRSNGDIGCDGKATQTGSSYTTGDIISIAYDAATRRIWFAKNGTWQLSGNPASGSNEIGTLNSPTGNYFFGFAIYDTNTGTANFGQRPFAYTAPSGFKALCDTNLPAPVVAKPSTVMNVKLYTGNGSTQTVSGLQFSPDLVWIKQRDTTRNHVLYDTVRGATKALLSSTTDSEQTYSTSLTAFNSDGFALGSDDKSNGSSGSYAAWTWDAGSSTVTNTQGSITSQVRANASAGFSIVTYTGNGTSGATVGHGGLVNLANGMIIIKRRDSAVNWFVGHGSQGWTKVFEGLNTTNAISTTSAAWNNTSPTSTVFTLGSETSMNGNGGTFVAYCFAPVAGYSSFGSYTGNGSATDGPFVYTGFRPRWVMYKSATNVSSPWVVLDTQRSTYNVNETYLYANAADAELSNFTFIDHLSNGFKLRSTSAIWNVSGATYIYAAFAENPFQFARAR